ncbi:PIG-L family deacetylase [Pendulispora rubella]|uniref:PIG-L family deacetylase n=1 Tax=Pendulispora rubella TaxID=2741070 RepID=A0ABZ2LHL4_9BACT
MSTATRRSLLLGMLGSVSACAAAPTAKSRPAVAVSGTSASATSAAQAPKPVRVPAPGARRSVVCICAHPDDAESGCGGTLIRLAKEGYRVQIIYTFSGAVPGKSLEEALPTRREEARRACRILGADPYFTYDNRGVSVLDPAGLVKVTAMLNQFAPDMVFAHWPLDAHEDHQIAALLGLRAVAALDPAPELYFFEVERGSQTMAFSPSVYVDITAVREQKVRALTEHESQDPWRLYERDHEPMELFRGREAGVKAAEAFVPLKGGSGRLLHVLA